jgi:membrane associated rhomboid family serine protease
MGIYDRDYNSEYDKFVKRKSFFNFSGNSLFTLIAINLLVFVGLQMMNLVYFFVNGKDAGGIMFNDQVMDLFVLPSDANTLLFRPWTLVTYMFTHFGFLHIFANMLWLWAFGSILKDLSGDKHIVPVYIYGGLAGGLAFVLSYNLFPAFQNAVQYSSLLGASAGAMCIAVAATTLSPTYRIYPMLWGGIPLWILTGLYLIIDIATIPNSNPGGRISHLAGALMGFIFIMFLKRNKDIGAWINNFFYWVNNLFNPNKPKRGKVIKSELFYKSKGEPYKKTPNLTQQRIDNILDKINHKGYSSLTEEEKELLKKAGEEL